LNARFPAGRQTSRPLPTGQAALAVLYLLATQQRKNRQDLAGKTSGWKTILNPLTIHYGERIAANTVS
jgi:hypothetical protein